MNRYRDAIGYVLVAAGTMSVCLGAVLLFIFGLLGFLFMTVDSVGESDSSGELTNYLPSQVTSGFILCLIGIPLATAGILLLKTDWLRSQ